jgi:hypothetical protein
MSTSHENKSKSGQVKSSERKTINNKQKYKVTCVDEEGEEREKRVGRKRVRQDKINKNLFSIPNRSNATM